MRASFAVAVLVLAALALTPSTAGAAAVPCPIGFFWPGLDDEEFPAVSRLRAIDLPRLTDGYAPRCLVAEAVAGLVKDGVAAAAREHGVGFRFDRHAPKRVRPAGARWTGGLYRVKYRRMPTYVRATATRGERRVRFRLGTG